ncbi:hypothetical protein K2173_008601 [Erythroxylum novogranatense]|uniref:Protein kinase domain-containing protein n=1 Tax=Erythroxylum novogranatense TaxID=1862640 RepID=A0AAV8SLI1_9ROSI|nr:hypothetical protein K2173_008601 [Erythroxylum novogranatense]
MGYSLEIKLVILCLFLQVLVGYGISVGGCEESKCGRRGPVIRFPFRLKDKQPEHCGFPGFDLTCTERRETLLELPTSAKLHINTIDYVSQAIVASDPNNCLPRQALNLSLSNTPFEVLYGFSYNYSLFSCASENRNMYYPSFPRLSAPVYDAYAIPCLSVPGYDVYLFSPSESFSYRSVASCEKMYTLPSLPNGGDNVLYLNWSIPACAYCEAQGKFCGWKSTDIKTDIQCFDRPKENGGTTKKIIASVVAVGSFLIILLALLLYRLYRKDRSDKENQARVKGFLEDYKAFNPARYSYNDIKRITNEFKDKLGQGAYGTVYKGKLSDEVYVAVKILNSSKGNGEEFVNEVATMGRIHHVNVVRLVGYCADGFRRALVYEYLPNESLEKFISPDHDVKNLHLSWGKLQKIALGIAEGIDYLHRGCDQRILHFDIKPHNILLDDNFNPKISDFGMAKLCAKDQSAVSMTTARGTLGYIAPEVFSRNFGNVSYKSDVYSYGMVLLEVVGGRKQTIVTTDNVSHVNFPEWAYNCLYQGEELRIQIEEESDHQIAKKLTIVGLWCIQWHPVERPHMKTVVQMLEEEGDKLTVPPNPFSSRMNADFPGKFHHQELEVISETE